MTGNLYDRNPRYHYGDGAKAKLGVILEDCRDVTLNGEHYGGEVLEHPAALQLRRCDAVNVHGCSFARLSRAGILVDSVAFGQISGCLFTGITEMAIAVEQQATSDVDANTNRFRRLQ